MVPVLIAIHVVLVVLWIGGVGFVTLVIFPQLLKMESSLEQVLFFHRMEGKFAKQAKAYVWLTGLTGALLLYFTGRHTLLFRAETLGISVMIVVWALYLLVLTFEKRVFGKLFAGKEQTDSRKVFRFLTAFHWAVLGMSLLAVFVGVWQGHGGGL
ncbi:MAG: hypothetical protein P8Y85_00435 [Nitrospirota bacterium]|jgi:uncharacterized membrane protein